MGIAVAISAVALGANVIEKHFTLTRSDGVPDSAFSLEPEEFRQMVGAIRIAEESLGKVTYGIQDQEKESRIFRRSLFVVQDIHTGKVFTDKNVRAIRPGYGIHTRHLDDILGRRASKDVERGTPLDWDLIGEPPG